MESENRYKRLNEKTAKETADIVADVKKYNYLAHSIREIEFAILKLKGKHYHIITYATTTNLEKAITIFHDNCCIIRLPYENEEMDDCKIRLILAHELGHLIFNFEDLMNPEKLNDTGASSAEEQYAWEFAYNIVRKKSDEHRSNSRQKKFVFEDVDLKKMLSAIVKKKVKPEVYGSIVKSLNLPSF